VALRAAPRVNAPDLVILLIAHKDRPRISGNDYCQPVGRNMRKASWRAKLREGALSLLALTTLVSILYVADVRVREGATHIISSTSNTGVARYGSQFAADTSKVVRDVRDGGVQHAALTALVGSAGVLLLFMLKT